MNSVILFKQMTSNESGAIAVFHLYGSEAALSSRVDVLLRAKESPTPGRCLARGDLGYGWLFSPAANEPVDEVMLAKPMDGMRVVMTHGGVVITAAVADLFRHCGFVEMPDGDTVKTDPLDDPVLSHCLTEAQAAAVLRWRAGGAKPKPGLLATHRVVLAGAPNAGKSSLLNHLSGYDRAFVHAEAGATRDAVDELVEVGGYAVWIGDLPGYAAGSSVQGSLAEAAWQRAVSRLRQSEMVWFVADASTPWEGETAEAAAAVAAVLAAQEVSPRILVVANKADLPTVWRGEPWRAAFPHAEAVRVSALPHGDALEVIGAAAARLW